MVSPAELSEAIIASLIIAMSLVAGALAAVRRPLGDRTALWFSLVGCLYGVRLSYTTAEVALNAGDRVVVYSDGLVEACAPGDHYFGDARLGQLLAAGTAGEPEQCVDHIVAELQRWIGQGTPLQDDVTVVVVDVTV